LRLFSEIGAIVIGVISGLWLYYEPGYEPLIVFLSAIGAVFGQAYVRYRDRDITTLIGKIISPLIRWKERNTPIASTSFNTLSGSKAINHEVRIWNIWDDTSPTGKAELRHKASNGSWVTFDHIEGHHVEIWTRDVNADGNPELLVRFACGAHTRVLKIFRVNTRNNLILIPGAEIGSDWPEINIEDRDGDGKIEVYAKQRNWKGIPSQEFVSEVYKYINGEYTKIENA